MWTQWNSDIKADVLKLSAKGIKRIKVGAFGDSRFASNVNLVRKLDLSMNDIKSLEPGVFDGLESLRAVNIYGNPRPVRRDRPGDVAAGRRGSNCTRSPVVPPVTFPSGRYPSSLCLTVACRSSHTRARATRAHLITPK